MNSFQYRAAVRIALVTIVLAGFASAVAWYLARETAEDSVVSLAIEESERFLRQSGALRLDNADARVHAENAARTIAGGLFDIAEVYGPDGDKLAEAMTEAGESVESALPKHPRPGYSGESYESLELPNGVWVLRVFVPLHEGKRGTAAPITGYFEGVRVIPDWQRDQITHSAFQAALLAALAAIVCGITIYPIVVRLSADNERKAREVLDSHISMMEALGRAIAKRDSDTGAHNYRVAWIAARIGEPMGLIGARMQALIAGSFLHDVGKIGIPDAILLKPGRLDAAEMEIMRTHVTQGEEIVRGMGWLDGAHEVVAAHHEKWDGSGYPRQLRGTSIPLAARIFAVADVFDALSSKRPYKEPMPYPEVMEILRRDTGTHFDPAVMQTFEAIADEIQRTLAGTSEQDARLLLEARILRHFESL